jgi:uncharacterized protein
MIYLDANFFIIATLTNEKGKKARTIAKEITQGKQAITSSLALDEVMWIYIKNNRKQEIRKIIEEIYIMPNLQVKEVPATVPLRALEFIEHYNLKPRDAFHCAVMEHFHIKEIVSDDKDFDKVQTIRRVKIN